MNPVLLFPGQGSQYIGMGKSFYDHVQLVRDIFEEASAILQMDLKRLCFEGPESVLVQTENVQPAVTLVNLACFHVIRNEGVLSVAAAGHSLGEYAALYAAGVFSLTDTLKLVRSRGQFMQGAAGQNPGGMIAVMGLEFGRLQEICEQVQSVGSIEVANHNSPRQVILTGQHEALKTAGELAKKSGAKLVVPLKVSGPWHSKFMRSASIMMEGRLATCSMKVPTVPVVSNVTGNFYLSTEEIRSCLVQQIVRPVKWVDCITQLIRSGNRIFVEVGPGRTLAGLMRDIDKEVKVINVEKPDDLARLKA